MLVSLRCVVPDKAVTGVVGDSMDCRNDLVTGAGTSDMVGFLV